MLRPVPFRSVEDPTTLRRVLEATRLIEANLELSAVLRRVVDEACSLTGARYGALGVLHEDKRSLSEFITVGLSADEEAAIGRRPTGRGVLGLLMEDPRAIRLTSIGDHPASVGFPADHPQMASFLGVPIKVRDEVYGNLYLSDKVGSSEFTLDDIALVEALSLGAGIAIENARLHERVRRSAVVEDRDRVARDLHDTVIQQLFALGLTVQSMTDQAGEPQRQQLRDLVDEIDRIIAQVRATVYELGMGAESRGLRDGIRTLADELGALLGLPVAAAVDGPVDTAVPVSAGEQVLAALREGVMLAARRPGATRVAAAVSATGGTCTLVVTADGTAVTGEDDDLAALRHRAEKLHGTLEVDDGASAGTALTLTWRVPITKEHMS
jgi:signal transduction histidine kinase